MSRGTLLASTVPERARTVPFVPRAHEGDIRDLAISLARSGSFNEDGLLRGHHPADDRRSRLDGISRTTIPDAAVSSCATRLRFIS